MAVTEDLADLKTVYTKKVPVIQKSHQTACGLRRKLCCYKKGCLMRFR